MKLGTLAIAFSLLLCMPVLADKQIEDDDEPTPAFQNPIVWVLSIASGALMGAVAFTDWIIASQKKLPLQGDDSNSKLKRKPQGHNHRRSQVSWSALLGQGDSLLGEMPFVRGSPSFEFSSESDFWREETIEFEHTPVEELECLTATLSDGERQVELLIWPQQQRLELTVQNNLVYEKNFVIGKAVIRQLINALDSGSCRNLGFRAKWVMKELRKKGFNLLPN